jgi:hypothetical protein
MGEEMTLSEIVQYVRGVLKYLHELRPFRGQEELIRDAEQHLARLLDFWRRQAGPGVSASEGAT